MVEGAANSADDLGPEWRLLERIAVLDDGDAAGLGAALSLTSSGLDVDRLVALAIRQRLLAALADFLLRTDRQGLLPSAMRLHTIASLQHSRYRTGRLVAEALRITAGFAERGLVVACTKGVVLQQTLYDGRGTRHMSDVDLMIPPHAQEAARQTLLDLGYAWAKRFDPARDELVDLPREVLAVYRLYPDHLPHFTRTTGDGAVPVQVVDVAFSLTWFGSRWEVPIDAAFAELDQVAVRHGRLPTLAVPYAFLFLVFHLFREAWYERFATQNDVRLSQFADVVRLWRRADPRQAERIRALVRDFDLGEVVAWVCHHADTLFGTRLTAELGVAGHGDDEWFRSAGGPGSTVLRWDGDMRRRLAGVTPLAFQPVGAANGMVVVEGEIP